MLAAQPTTNPVGGAGPCNPAYIIYTSGSTGQPKGVVVEHRNVVHSTWSRIQYYRAPGKNVALIPSIAFDASVAVIFWALCEGDTLSLPPKGAEQNMNRMAEWVQRHRVTHWLSVASLYNLLLDQPAGDWNRCEASLSAVRRARWHWCSGIISHCQRPSSTTSMDPPKGPFGAPCLIAPSMIPSPRCRLVAPSRTCRHSCSTGS